jgi:hypothetical protein
MADHRTTFGKLSEGAQFRLGHHHANGALLLPYAWRKREKIDATRSKAVDGGTVLIHESDDPVTYTSTQ